MENNNPPDENDLNKKFNEQFGNQNNPNPNPNINNPNPNFNNPNPNFNQGNFQNPYNNPQGAYQQPFTQQGFSQPLPPVPGAVGGLVLGIIGTFFSIICVYWIFAGMGLIMSIIALVISNKAIKQYAETPGIYSESSLGNAKAGRILGIVGIVIAVIWFLVLFVGLFIATSFANNLHF